MKVGSALKVGARKLGVVCDGPDSAGEFKLLLDDGSVTDWIKAAALARPSEAELEANPWLTQPLLGDDTGFVKSGSALKMGARKLGVVWTGPDLETRDDRVKLILEDGSMTIKIKAAALARPSEAELEASRWTAECWVMWVKLGAPAKRDDGALGVVREGPDEYGGVQLLLEDGPTTGGIKAMKGHCPTATRTDCRKYTFLNGHRLKTATQIAVLASKATSTCTTRRNRSKPV